jgi:ABC-type phosphate transport system substrate-binding protein
MTRPGFLSAKVLCATVIVLCTSMATTLGHSSMARADTPAGTVYGEGGAAMNPVLIKLLRDDGSALVPDYGSYTNVDLDQAIADFVGCTTAVYPCAAPTPNTFGADFAVTERPLTAAEAATAAANGRSFAYVPFAAAPVAIMTLVPNNTYQGGQTITSSQFCQHIPLTVDQLGQIFGYDAASPLTSWGDPRIQCSATAGTTADATPIVRWGNLDPTMENYALLSTLNSTPTAQAYLQAGIQQAIANGTAEQSTTAAASEYWPYASPAIPGGDEALLGKIIALNPLTDTPSTTAALLALGAVTPVSSVWTGAPLGVALNLPTAAIQNAQGSYVSPSVTSAEASEADATLASTGNPLTNNLVTFNADPTDAAAYNNLLMLQSYFVVPTNGLPADKATALAQFIRFALGKTGQSDIESLGAAPATPAMVATGLKVASQLNAEAALSSNAVSGTTTTTTGVAAGQASSTGGSAGSGAAGTGASPGTSGSGSSASGLAFTGSDPIPLVVLGGGLVFIGEAARRRIRRRSARP